VVRTKIRKCDEGTEFAAALTEGNRIGASRATDAQLMAMFCEDIMQQLVGAYSPGSSGRARRKPG
jgi:hypothetical protein